MTMLNSTWMRQFKAATLMAALLSGTMLWGSCSVTDIQKNIVAGALDFVSGYTTDILTGVSPTPPDLFE